MSVFDKIRSSFARPVLDFRNYRLTEEIVRVGDTMDNSYQTAIWHGPESAMARAYRDAKARLVELENQRIEVTVRRRDLHPEGSSEWLHWNQQYEASQGLLADLATYPDTPPTPAEIAARRAETEASPADDADQRESDRDPVVAGAANTVGVADSSRLEQAQQAVHAAEQRLRRLHEQDPHTSGEFRGIAEPDWDGERPTAEELETWAHVLNRDADRQDTEVAASVAEQAAQEALVERVARGMTYTEAGQVLRENESVMFRSGLPAPDSPRVEAARRVMVDGPDAAITRTQPLPVVPARLRAAGTDAALLLLRAQEAAAERALQDARAVDASGKPLWQLLDIPAARQRLGEAREELVEAQRQAQAGRDVNAWWLDRLLGQEEAAERELENARGDHARHEAGPGYHPGSYEMHEDVAEEALLEAREARLAAEQALSEVDRVGAFRVDTDWTCDFDIPTGTPYSNSCGRAARWKWHAEDDEFFCDIHKDGVPEDYGSEQAYNEFWSTAAEAAHARGETAAEELAGPRPGDMSPSEYESEVSVAMRMSPHTAELIVAHDQARREHQADCVGTAEQCEDCAIEENHRDRRGAAEGRLIKLDAAQRVLAETDRAVERGELDPEHVRSANRWLRQCRQVEDDLETYLQDVYDAEPGRFEDAQAHAEYWESRLASAARSRESAERAVSRLGLDAACAEERAAEAALEELVEHFDRPLTGEASYHEEGWAAEEKAAELRLTEAREARETVERQLGTLPAGQAVEPAAGQVVDDALGGEVDEVLAYDWSEYRYAQGLDDLGDDSDNEGALAGHDTAVVVEELQVVPRPGLPLSWLHVNEWQSELSPAELGRAKQTDAMLEARHRRMMDQIFGRENLPDAVEAALTAPPAEPAVVVEQGDAEYDDPEGDDILERLTPMELEGARLTREGVGDPDPDPAPEPASMGFGFVAPPQRSGGDVVAAVDAARDAVNKLSDQRSRAERDQADYDRERQTNLWARPYDTGHDHRSGSSADAYGLDL